VARPEPPAPAGRRGTRWGVGKVPPDTSPVLISPGELSHHGRRLGNIRAPAHRPPTSRVVRHVGPGVQKLEGEVLFANPDCVAGTVLDRGQTDRPGAGGAEHPV